MTFKLFTASAVLCTTMLAPVAASAQYVTERSHERARAAQHRHDARHHTKAKIVGGSAVGGAVVGGLLGGPKGAVIGAGVGAGGGLLANKMHRDHQVRERERTGRY
jgi:uncharacterized protein YcfJ